MSKLSNYRLVQLLTKASQDDSNNEMLMNLYIRHDKYSPESLVEELRDDGSNTFARICFRSGTGVDYDEITRDVAEKLGIENTAISDDETKNELLIIQAACKKYFDDLSDEEREEKLKDLGSLLGSDSKNFVNALLLGTPNALLIAIQTVGVKVAQRIIAEILSVIIARQAAMQFAKFFMVFVPWINALLSLWLIIDIAGPAYRKTVPSVMEIATLRLYYGNEG